VIISLLASSVLTSRPVKNSVTANADLNGKSRCTLGGRNEKAERLGGVGDDDATTSAIAVERVWMPLSVVRCGAIDVIAGL